MSLSGERGRLLPRRFTHAAAEGGSGARRRSVVAVGRGLCADSLSGESSLAISWDSRCAVGAVFSVAFLFFFGAARMFTASLAVAKSPPS